MPNLPQLIVVFDTNAYLGADDATIAAIVNAEARAQVFALASVWPCLELLSHCGTDNQRKSARARQTLRKIWAHAGYTTSDERRLRLQEAGEVTLVRGLFGRTPEEPLLELGFVGDLVVAAVTEDPATFISSHRSELSQVAERVRLEEVQFAGLTSDPRFAPDRSKGLRQATGDPSAPLLVAAGLVKALAEKYGVNLADIDTSKAVHGVAVNYPIAMHFMCDLLYDAGTSGVIPGGGNSGWDLKLTFHAGPGATVSGIPTLLVSDDRRLLRAASRANAPQRVLRLLEYQALLNNPTAVGALAQHLLRTA